MKLCLGLILAQLLLAQAPASLDDIRKDPDPIRRFDRSLAFAASATKEARQLVRDGGSRTELFQLLDSISSAAELSIESLRSTGKKPSKLSRQYKKGELQLRDIVRQMSDLVAAINIDDRPPAEKVRDQLQTYQEEYLLGVMSK